VGAIAIAKSLKVPVLTQAAASKVQVLAQISQAQLMHLTGTISDHGQRSALRDKKYFQVLHNTLPFAR
jgi:hypothetical protein